VFIYVVLFVAVLGASFSFFLFVHPSFSHADVRQDGDESILPGLRQPRLFVPLELFFFLLKAIPFWKTVFSPF